MILEKLHRKEGLTENELELLDERLKSLQRRLADNQAS
jgi:hypothetical protein